MKNVNDKQTLLNETNEIDETVVGVINLTDAELGVVAGGRVAAGSPNWEVTKGTDGFVDVVKCVA